MLVTIILNNTGRCALERPGNSLDEDQLQATTEFISWRLLQTLVELAHFMCIRQLPTAVACADCQPSGVVHTV